MIPHDFVSAHFVGAINVSPLQAIANETGINFISVKGPELLNMVRLFLV